MEIKEVTHVAYINLTPYIISVLIEEKLHVKQIHPDKINNYKKVSSGYHNLTIINNANNEVLTTKKINLRPESNYMIAIKTVFSKGSQELKCVMAEERNMSFRGPYYAVRIGNFIDSAKVLNLYENNKFFSSIQVPFSSIGAYFNLDPSKKYFLEIIDFYDKKIHIPFPKLKKFRIYTLFLVYNPAKKTHHFIVNIDRTSYHGNNLSLPDKPPKKVKKAKKDKKIKNQDNNNLENALDNLDDVDLNKLTRHGEESNIIKTGIGTTTEILKQTSKNGIKAVDYGLGKGTDVVKYTGEKTIGAAKYTGEKTIDAVKYTAGKTGDAVKYTAGKTGDVVKYTGEKTIDAVKYTGEKTIDVVKYTAGKTGDVAKYTGEKTIGAAKFTGEETK